MWFRLGSTRNTRSLRTHGKHPLTRRDFEPAFLTPILLGVLTGIAVVMTLQVWNQPSGVWYGPIAHRTIKEVDAHGLTTNVYMINIRFRESAVDQLGALPSFGLMTEVIPTYPAAGVSDEASSIAKELLVDAADDPPSQVRRSESRLLKRISEDASREWGRLVWTRQSASHPFVASWTKVDYRQAVLQFTLLLVSVVLLFVFMRSVVTSLRLASRHPRNCPQCNYDLSRHESDRCPECGLEL